MFWTKDLKKKRIFIQGSRRGIMGYLVGSLLLATTLPVNRAEAAQAKLRKTTAIYEKPDEEASPGESLSEGQIVNTFEKAPGGWIRVQSGKNQGWIKAYRIENLSAESSVSSAPTGPVAETAVVAPPETLRAIPPAESVVATPPEAQPTVVAPKKKKRVTKKPKEPLAPVPDENTQEDSERFEAEAASPAKKIATRQGRLYDEPNNYAQRYGLVEAQDEFEVLGESDDHKWTQVRLKITGEEGWFPTAWIGTISQKIFRRAKDASLEFNLGYASNDYSVGAGMGYFYNLAPNGFEGRARDRFELGAALTYFKGLTTTSGSASLSSQFWVTQFLLRYVGASEDSYWSGAGEAGLAYVYAKLANSGLSDEVLAANGLGIGASGVRPVLGLRAIFSNGSNFQFPLGVRILVGNGLTLFTYIGCDYRF